MTIRLSDTRTICNLIMASLLLSFAAGPSLCQGGQGGGFGGGGMGGSGRPVDADRTVGRSILSPGQFGEWPITAREGETIIVRISSTVFDPAVEVVDADNKVIAQNDDVRTGEQDAQVVVTFTKAGRYRILVKAFKMAGGGQYEFSMRRFVASPTTLGARMAGSLDQTKAKWFHFSANAGQTVIITARASSYRPNIQLFTPVGDEREAPVQDIDRGRRAVVSTPAKGTYYVRIGGQGGERGDSYAATISLARELKTAVGQANPAQTLEAGGLDIWTIQGKAGDLVRLEAKSDKGSVYISPEFANTDVSPTDSALEESRATPLVTLPADPKAPGETVVLLNKTGAYRVSVSQPLALSASYTLSSKPAGREWKDGDDPEGALRLGDSDYWTLQGKAGQIIEMEASSSTFDSVIELYNPTGDRVGLNDDGAGARNALVTQLLSATGRYLVRVHAHGDGGSGAYKLRRLPNPVKPLPIGALTKGAIGDGSAGIWSFTGHKDQTIIISVRSSDFDTYVRIYGPDGLEIASADDGGEGTDSLLAVRLPLDGTYTIWTSAKSGSGSYTIKVADADK